MAVAPNADAVGPALVAVAGLPTQGTPIAVLAEVLPEVMTAGGAGKGPQDVNSPDTSMRCLRASEGGRLALREHGAVLHVPVGARAREGCLRLIAERSSGRGLPSAFEIGVGTTTCKCRFAVPTSLRSIDAKLTAGSSRMRIEGQGAADYCVDANRLRVRRELDGEPVVEVYRRL